MTDVLYLQKVSCRTQFEMGENYDRTICITRLYSASVNCRTSGRIGFFTSER